MSTMIRFEDLEVPALTEIAKEQFEECVWAIEKALKKQLEFGRLLLIVKSKLPHGEWGTWVRETFDDHKSLRQIQRHMRAAEAIATNPSLLESADSLDGVLKLVESPKPSVEVIETTATVPQKAIEPPKKPVKESPSTPAEAPVAAVETLEVASSPEATPVPTTSPTVLDEILNRPGSGLFNRFKNDIYQDSLSIGHYVTALQWESSDACLKWASSNNATVAEMVAHQAQL